ncbi:MAG: response regulator [Planctomycetota bacterium]
MIQQPTVLIAEDDPVFRHLLQYTLQRAGYRVVAVADGESAWQRWLAGGIHLLVTDQQMPRCSGIELISRIEDHCRSVVMGDDTSRDGSPSERTPIILCTAKGLELDRRRLSDQLGLIDVLSKPFSPKQLTRLADGVLKGNAVNPSSMFFEPAV